MKTGISSAARSSYVHVDVLENRSLCSGGLDPSFGTGGIATLPVTSFHGITAMAVQSNGNVVAGMVATLNGHYVFDVYRLTANGALDPSFGSHGQVQTTIPGGDANILSLLVQPDGKIVAAGNVGVSTGFGETTPSAMAIVRYNANGTLDTSFNSTGIVEFAHDQVPALAWQDNKILVCSYLTIRRLNNNGSVDSTFHSGDPGALAVAVQSDGKIVTGLGNFQSGNANPFARYNANGTVDKTFNSGGATLATDYGSPIVIAIEPDGTIVSLLADFAPHTSGGQYIAALTPSGAVDTGFAGGNPISVGAGFYGADTFVIQPDGKLIVVKPELVPSVSFTGFMPIGIELDRYSSAGVLDTTFGTHGSSDIAYSVYFDGEYDQGSPIAIDPSGRLLLADSAIVAIDTRNDSGSISGYMFYDFNGNGKRDPGDHVLNWTCYIDVDNDGHFDNADIRIHTDANGNFAIPNLAPGVYHIRQSQVSHWQKTTPDEYTVTVSAGETVTGIVFGSREIQ